MRRTICLLILVLGSILWAFGQDRPIEPTSIDLSPLNSLDTLSSPIKKNSFTSIFYGDPGKAALYSLIVPGGGQLYNKRWWKAPIIWAGEGYFVYSLLQRIENFSEISQCRTDIIKNGGPVVCEISEETIPIVYNTSTEIFEDWQDSQNARDQAWIFLSAAHLINVFEAFVDRHLINFDVSDDLTISTQPNPLPPGIDNGTFTIVTPQVEFFTLSISLN